MTHKVLAGQLRELERDGLVSRRVYAEVPPRVEYSLTDTGRTLDGVFQALCDWGERHAMGPAARKAPPRPTAAPADAE